MGRGRGRGCGIDYACDSLPGMIIMLMMMMMMMMQSTVFYEHGYQSDAKKLHNLHYLVLLRFRVRIYDVQSCMYVCTYVCVYILTYLLTTYYLLYCTVHTELCAALCLALPVLPHPVLLWKG